MGRRRIALYHVCNWKATDGFQRRCRGLPWCCFCLSIRWRYLFLGNGTGDGLVIVRGREHIMCIIGGEEADGWLMFDGT